MDRIAFAAASNPRMVAHGRTRLCPPAVLARPVGGASSVASSGAPPRNTRMPLQTIAPHWIYAQHGNDIVHPTPEAHILMGRVVAQYVVHRLYTAGRDEGQQLLQQAKHQHQHQHDEHRERRRDSASSGVRDASSSTGNWSLSPPLPGSPLQGSPLQGAGFVPTEDGSGSVLWEECFNAETIPVSEVVNPGRPPWQVVDEGAADKGIRKLGLLSRVLGETIVLGPIGRELQTEAMQRLALQLPAGWAPKVSIELGYLLAPKQSFGVRMPRF